MKIIPRKYTLPVEKKQYRYSRKYSTPSRGGIYQPPTGYPGGIGGVSNRGGAKTELTFLPGAA